MSLPPLSACDINGEVSALLGELETLFLSLLRMLLRQFSVKWSLENNRTVFVDGSKDHNWVSLRAVEPQVFFKKSLTAVSAARCLCSREDYCLSFIVLLSPVGSVCGLTHAAALGDAVYVPDVFFPCLLVSPNQECIFRYRYCFTG